MHTVRRTRSSAIMLGAAILLASVGAAFSVPAGASSPTLPQTSAAQSAAAWLGGQFGAGGYIPLSGSSSPDLSSTANAVLALAAAGVDTSTAKAGLTYLEANSAAYITADGSDGPGPLSLLILDAHALGVNPTDFGGTNLVARLVATEQTSGPDAGLFGTEDQLGKLDAGTYIQGLAFTALKAAGVTADAPAKTWLIQQQCPDGGWALPDIATNSCTEDPAGFSGPDTNSTSLAVEGLTAQGAVTPTSSANALAFLQGAQNTDGGFGYQPTNSSDPDSTALVIQGLLALGQDPSSATYTQDGNTPVSALLSYQISSGPDTGAMYFPGGSTTTGNLLATYQAVPPLAGLSFPFMPITRIYGQEPIDTSIAVSEAGFPQAGSAKAVVLARSDFFSDALAGGPLAAAVGGPLLITPGPSVSTTLDPRVQAEIQRVLPAGATVYILGGDLALDPSIDTTLEGLGYQVQRIAGVNEYATAVAIAQALGDPSTVFEATGLNFADALSAGPAAIGDHGAILLTDGTDQAPETAAYLAAHPGDTRYAIGGPLAAAGADPSATAVYGQDQYGTSAAVASTFFPTATTFGAATGATFPDALSGGVFLGEQPSIGPMLLVEPSGALPDPIASYLSATASTLTQGYLFGGPLAVGDDVAAELALTG